MYEEFNDGGRGARGVQFGALFPLTTDPVRDRV